jgi:hypothetical protein
MQVSLKGAEVGDSALTIYIASCEKLEELGYSVEERSAELEIMLMEDESPYDGDVMATPAVFLNLGPVPLNELTAVMDVLVSCGSKKCAVRWCSTCPRRAAIGGRSVVERVPPRPCLLCTSPAVCAIAIRRRRQAKFQSLRRILLRAVVNMVWDSSNV